MAIRPLTPQRLERLRAAPLTYSAVGKTATTPPDGYRLVNASRIVERRDFSAAVEDLLTWQVHRRAGLQVSASTSPVEPGTVLEMRWGLGPLALRVPCRVIYVVAEPQRRGFAYGTLPGHPVSGEELFVLHRRDDGQITFTISAFSRAATFPSRLGGPATTWMQDLMTRRYLAALDRPAR